MVVASPALAVEGIKQTDIKRVTVAIHGYSENIIIVIF